jgi:hypothetical protein
MTNLLLYYETNDHSCYRPGKALLSNRRSFRSRNSCLDAFAGETAVSSAIPRRQIRRAHPDRCSSAARRLIAGWSASRSAFEMGRGSPSKRA